MLKRIILPVLLFAVVAVAQNGSSRPYPIDNGHSTVGFSVPILGGLSQVKGKFTDFAITINNDEKDITKSSVSVVIVRVATRSLSSLLCKAGGFGHR